MTKQIRTTKRRRGPRERFGIQKGRKGRKRRGQGNSPFVEARVCYSDGGGILIDFRITKDDNGPVKIEAWAKGANLTGAIPYPASTPGSGLSCGPPDVLDPQLGVQPSTFFKSIGLNLNKAWVWARITLDDEDATKVEYRYRWTISPNPSFTFTGMHEV